MDVPMNITYQTCTDGICSRCAVTEPSHERDGDPVCWIQQWSPCPEQQRCCRHSSSRHSAADGETWTQAVWDICWREACEPDSAYHRSHQAEQSEQPPSFQPPASQTEVKERAIDVIPEERLFTLLQAVHCLTDTGDLDEFFQHEKPGLSTASVMGCLRTGTKSDLMPCLENLVPVKEVLV